VLAWISKYNAMEYDGYEEEGGEYEKQGVNTKRKRKRKRKRIGIVYSKKNILHWIEE
ncbi:hypothetical protein Tco_1387854, partial [Tanacetum coccineum]